MMNHVRAATLAAVERLSIEQLDYIHDATSNSIGGLLAHIAATEVGYQAATFHGRPLDDEEKRLWGAAFGLDDRTRREVRGNALEHYLRGLENVRALTLAELGRRDDAWLEEETTTGSGLRVNNHFKWFHVFGHEINHRGQIRWLRGRVPGMGAGASKEQ
jgi:uncharacterized damage-inducible protein DinB